MFCFGSVKITFMYESFDPVPELTQFPGTFGISDGDFPIIQNLGTVVLTLFTS